MIVFTAAAGWAIAAGVSALGQWYANRQERKFAEDMSNTSWQRGVADLRAAGLNPALAYGQGGASSPTARPGNIGSAAAQAIQLKNQTRVVKADVSLKKIQEMREYALAQKAIQERDYVGHQKDLAEMEKTLFHKTLKDQIAMVAAQLRERKSIADSNAARTLKMGKETGKVASEAKIAEWLASFYEKGGGMAEKVGAKELLRLLLSVGLKSSAY